MAEVYVYETRHANLVGGEVTSMGDSNFPAHGRKLLYALVSDEPEKVEESPWNGHYCTKCDAQTAMVIYKFPLLRLDAPVIPEEFSSYVERKLKESWRIWEWEGLSQVAVKALERLQDRMYFFRMESDWGCEYCEPKKV